jgi:small-conductance mechanosensitive channel
MTSAASLACRTEDNSWLMPSFDRFLQHPSSLGVPLLLLAGVVLGGLIVRWLLFRAIRSWAAKTDSHLDVLITQSLPIVLWSLILGIHIATQNSEIPRRYLQYIPHTLAVLWILSLTIAMSRLAGNLVRFYGGGITGAKNVTSLTQKLAQLVVVCTGLILMLKIVFNTSLTPILTTLGVGGLAVALALQDTLSNLFAGFHVSISGLLHIGDYIKLNTGEEGYVTDINWRCTMIRGVTNNLVVIPNAKLSQAIFTNYALPDPRIALSISIGVGYDSEIERVESILLEETTAAAGAVKGLLSEPSPYILFSPGPGDSALIFQINFTIGEFANQNGVLSELRKRIVKRLQREGITMPFPTRTVIVESKSGQADADETKRD